MWYRWDNEAFLPRRIERADFGRDQSVGNKQIKTKRIRFLDQRNRSRYTFVGLLMAC